MSINPQETIKKMDPALLDKMGADRDFAMGEGALSSKVKILMALAIDAALGAENGVKSLAIMAQKQGATRQEVMEAVRVAGYIGGVGSIYTAAYGLNDILDQLK